MEPNPQLQGYLANMEGTVCSPVQLIELVKLLGTGNSVLNQLYLKLVNTTLTQCYETRLQLEECRHLIWLIFRHPAFSSPERATLLHWVDVFDRLFPRYETESGYSSGGSDRSSSSSSPSPTQDKMFVYNANFVFPYTGTPAAAPLFTQCRRNTGVMFKRCQSDPAVPSGSYVGTRCKVQHRERAIDVTPHMTALMSWLKTLRLHKYHQKLSTMSYDHMLSLNENTLQDITEGARRKILLNIEKLAVRHQLLTDIMLDLSKPGRFNTCITELHTMLMKTPFRLPPSSNFATTPDPTYEAPDTELIVLYTTVLGTAGNIILANNIEEDCQKLFFKLLEDAGQHAAFPDKQRLLVCDILQQSIDNYNYRNGQVIQLKRWDLTNFPHSVKIKYPIKPINGMNHQTNGYGTYHNKFTNRTKLNWQPHRMSHKTPLLQSNSAPVAPPSYSPFQASIWSSPSTSQATSWGFHDIQDHNVPGTSTQHHQDTSSFAAGPLSPTEHTIKGDPLDYVGLESLCSQIAECALAEK